MSIDYRDFRPKGTPEKKRDAAKSTNSKWWTLPETEVPESVIAVVSYLDTNQADRRTQLLTAAGLYASSTLLDALRSSTGLAMAGASTAGGVSNLFRDVLTFNVTQSVVDTVVSRLSKTKPRVQFLTDGADWRTQRKAEEMTFFIDGCFYECGMYKLGEQSWRDGLVLDAGVVHVFSRDGRVCAERILSSEIRVDLVDGMWGTPTQMYRSRAVDRETLIADFATDEDGKVDEEKAQKIRDASGPKGEIGNSSPGGIPTISDTVQVYEAWHLRSGKNAKDGKHILTIENCILFQEEWTRDGFPFAFLRWSDRTVGFFGQSLVEQLAPIQRELNQSLYVLSKSIKLGGSFTIFLENNSKVNTAALNNAIGKIVKFTGTKPIIEAPPPVSPVLLQHIQDCISRAYQQAGVSQLTAMSLKPAGADSGKALRTLIETEGDRFVTQQRTYDNMYVEVAKLMLQEVAELTKNGKRAYKVRAPKRNGYVQIDFKNIALDPDDYSIRPYPTNALTEEPAGRIADIQELMQAGLLDPQEGRRLLDYPDLKSVSSLDNAMMDLIHKQMDAMLFDGEPQTPEPEDNLQLALKISLETYAWARAHDVKDTTLSLIRTYIAQVQAGIKAGMPQPPPGAAPGAAGAPQGAVPAQPAVSPMLPNAPGVPG